MLDEWLCRLLAWRAGVRHRTWQVLTTDELAFALPLSEVERTAWLVAAFVATWRPAPASAHTPAAPPTPHSAP